MYSGRISSKYITDKVKCPTTPWFIPLSIISIIFLSLSLIFASSKNMKSHLEESGIFLTSAEAVKRADRKCLQVHSECIRWMAGATRWEEGDGIISRNSYQRFNFPRVATNIRCMRATYSMLRPWRTESRLDRTIAIHGARCEGNCYKICGNARRRNCCNQSLLSDQR